jgi:hypothetical protein
MFIEISNAYVCNFSPGAIERSVQEPLKMTFCHFCFKIAASSEAPFAAYIQANDFLGSKI